MSRKTPLQQTHASKTNKWTRVKTTIYDTDHKTVKQCESISQARHYMRTGKSK